jgi:diguanylate cyclase (GGDEF)-like protein/putative nucleotidyltransferase with HDIG domain
MRTRAKAYLAFVVTTGAILIAQSLASWHLHDVVRNTCYLLPAVLATGLKLKVRQVAGLISGSYVFILLGFPELNQAETVVIGCLATLMETLWQTRLRPRWHEALFHTTNMAVAVYAAYSVYHSRWALELDSTLVAVALSACTFFFINTISLATLSSLLERTNLVDVWQSNYLFSLPYYLVGASVTWLIAGVSRQISWQGAMLVLAIVFIIYRSYRMYLVLAVGRKRHTDEIAALQLRTIEALALAIEAKDQKTQGHLRRVQTYAIAIGKELGLSESELDALRAASVLHDIGKLAIPDYITSKAGKLTPEEFEKMKIHPIVGAEILSHMKFPYPVVPIVKHHHERWDGTGYPSGLKGEEIPIGARILAAVDCLDALASDRQYRRALPLMDAVERVSAGAGKAFDPKVVSILKRRYVEIEDAVQAKRDNASLLHSEAHTENRPQPAAAFAPAPAGALADEPESLQFVDWISSARREGQLMQELTTDLGKSLNVDENMSSLARRINQLIPHDTIAVYTSMGDRRLTAAFVSGENARLFSGSEVALGEGLSGWVAEHNKPILNGNPAVEPGYSTDPARLASLLSALSVPLRGSRGPAGVLTLYHQNRDAFTREHLRILLAIAATVGPAVENSLQYQHVESSAATDYLTGLPNARSLFLHLDVEMERASREHTPLAIVVCDLDGFKQVNDRFGHLAGNKILRIVASGLRESCRGYDYVARLGGDEFVLVLPGISKEMVEARLAQLCEVADRAGFEVCGEHILSISAGTASYPDDGSDGERLLDAADQRMYDRKREGRNLRLATATQLARLASVPELGTPSSPYDPRSLPAKERTA